MARVDLMTLSFLSVWLLGPDLRNFSSILRSVSLMEFKSLHCHTGRLEPRILGLAVCSDNIIAVPTLTVLMNAGTYDMPTFGVSLPTMGELMLSTDFYLIHSSRGFQEVLLWLFLQLRTL